MSKYLIFDATSSRKITNYKAEHHDVNSWPELVHLSWIGLNEDCKPTEDHNYIIKPQNYELTDAVMKYARIDQEDVNLNSEGIEVVLKKFNESVEQAEYVFVHNLNANAGIVGASMVRNEITNNLNYSENICLMQESTFYCKIPKPKNKGKGFKWPTLNELHEKIFKKGYHPGNNARADVLASTRCFMALMKIGFLEDVFE